MYMYIDGIFHAQASANQVAPTHDLSLPCDFRLGFVINLQKLTLVLSQVVLHLGALIDTARGLVFPSPAHAGYDRTYSSGLVGSNPGLCSMPSSGDRAAGFPPCSGFPVHVPSLSLVDSHERLP